MPDPRNDIDELRRILLAVTKPHGSLSRRALSLKAGLGQDAVRDILNGRNKNPSYEAAQSLRFAIAMETAAPLPVDEALMSADKPKWSPSWMYVAEVGVWRELTAVEVSYGREATDSILNIGDKYAPNIGRFGVKLADDSMKPKFLNGDILECWSAIDASFRPQPGHTVVVQRTRDNLIETTLRDLEVGNAMENVLTYASPEPRFAERLNVKAGSWGDYRDGGPSIIGVVRGMYRTI